MYENWYIVKKSFNSGSELLTPGNPVNTAEWRNTRSLKEAGYIRDAAGPEDLEKIRVAIEATQEPNEPAKLAASDKTGEPNTPARRGNPNFVKGGK